MMAARPNTIATVATVAAALALSFTTASADAAQRDETAMDFATCPAASEHSSAKSAITSSFLTPGARFQPVDLKDIPKTMDKQAGDYPGLCRYREANQALQSAPRVVFFGDSITDAWINGDPSIFGDGVVDRGISGQTTGQMLGRFEDDVIALHPQVVHIMAGTNDVAGNTGPTNEETFRNNIRAMVSLAKAAGVRVVIGSILPADHFWWAPRWRPARRIVQLNDWLRSFANDNGVAYVDYYSLLATPEGGMDRRYANDGVHPNRDGYALMRPLAAAAIAEDVAR